MNISEKTDLKLVTANLFRLTTAIKQMQIDGAITAEELPLFEIHAQIAGLELKKPEPDESLILEIICRLDLLIWEAQR